MEKLNLLFNKQFISNVIVEQQKKFLSRKKEKKKIYLEGIYKLIKLTKNSKSLSSIRQKLQLSQIDICRNLKSDQNRTNSKNFYRKWINIIFFIKIIYLKFIDIKAFDIFRIIVDLKLKRFKFQSK